MRKLCYRKINGKEFCWIVTTTEASTPEQVAEAAGMATATRSAPIELSHNPELDRL